MRIPVKRVNEYPRTIYLYSKGDYENMNEELFQISLNEYDPNRDMDTNWRHVREVYHILIDKYVPRKLQTHNKITNPQQICDLLNDFFTSVMTKTDPIDREIAIPGPTPETLLTDTMPLIYCHPLLFQFRKMLAET